MIFFEASVGDSKLLKSPELIRTPSPTKASFSIEDSLFLSDIT